MKILQVAHSFVPYNMAGTEVYTYTLSKELIRKHDVSVFFRVNKPQEKEYSLRYADFEGIKTYSVNHTLNRCGSFRQTYDNKIIDKIFGGLLDRVKPDIVHIQHLLFLSLGIIKEAKERNIPVVFTLNDYWLFCHRGQLIKDDLMLCQDCGSYSCKVCLASQLSIRKNTIFFYNILRKNVSNLPLQIVKNIYLAFTRFSFLTPEKSDRQIQERFDYVRKILNGIDQFIAPSIYIKEKFIRFGVSESKIYISPYGLNIGKLIPIAKDSHNPIRFGYIGTLLPMKGVDILISAFKKIINQNAQLFIYGKIASYAGYESYHKRLKRMAKDDKRIRFMGHFDNSKIGEVLSNIDILVVPSIWPENAPLVMQEAFLSKTPIIASRIGGIPELVNDGVNAILFNAGDIDELRKKMEYVVGNPAVIEKFRANMPGVKSIENNAKEMEGIYHKAIALKNRERHNT